MGVHCCVLHDSVEKSESRQRPPAARQAHSRLRSSVSDTSWATASHHVLTSILQLMGGHCSRATLPTMRSPDSVGEKFSELCWAAASRDQRLEVIATQRPWPPSAYPEHPVRSRCLLSGTVPS